MKWSEKVGVGFICGVLLVAGCALPARLQAQIPQPDDAPLPLSVEESAATFQLPPGYRMELVASEPLIREPSGVCWDEQGRLYVCELHGYNLEGQYDIEELNKTGQLDREVRRIQAGEAAKRAALQDTYGTIKLLRDTDADGRCDQAQVFADRLPPCYGICPARGGIVVACAPDILFLADRDGDGSAEVREVLFTGFATGALERGINAPQWGLDNWIYFGRGHGGGRITGARLATPVDLPNSDFRIKPDGSAIEPILGSTHTIGFAFDADGERFVTSTQSPAIQVMPIPWRYLARNEDVSIRDVEHQTTAEGKVYPRSKPHPWRSKRADDPGFAKFYTDRYGAAESAPNGFFTSACSPLIYQDGALPGLAGQLFACEPAQNLVHRATLVRDGLRFRLQRTREEQQSEFLTSTDPWFHPISLTHAPDGSIWIVDFYREIIEDYSAIPRYLQQQYGLINGHQHGRLWRLTADSGPATVHPHDLADRADVELAHELASTSYWRRLTARRLLVERQSKSTVAQIRQMMLRDDAPPAVVLNAFYTLDGLAALRAADAKALLEHPAPSVRVHGLRVAERWLQSDSELVELVLQAAHDTREEVRLQAALTLGEWHDARALAPLAEVAAAPDADPWMLQAVLTSVSGRAEPLVELLLEKQEQASSSDHTRRPSRVILEWLASAIAARQDPEELSATLVRIAATEQVDVQQLLLEALGRRLEGVRATISLNPEARHALMTLTKSTDPEIRRASLALFIALRLETDEERRTRIAHAVAVLNDVQAAPADRLGAVMEVSMDHEPASVQALIDAFGTSTPPVRDAILGALFAYKDRHRAVLSAVESGAIPASALSTLQRQTLLEHRDLNEHPQAARDLAWNRRVESDMYERFATALQTPGDAVRGEFVFREKCASCHRAHGTGGAVGPDLTAEFQRSPETILKDILLPNDAITAGYSTYEVETTSGQVFSGTLASESAGSISLRTSSGDEVSVLRREIEHLRSTPLSMMPENLAETLTPRDVADVITWLSQPVEQLVLVDEDVSLVQRLDQGEGTAGFTQDDPYSGRVSLRVTPPQRYSAQLPGWSHRIREHPGPGEYRYLKFAWKAPQARGVVIELASDGAWPDADSPSFRYSAGENSTGWQAIEVSSEPPQDWVVVTRDLWRECGDCTLTGIAPTAIGGPVQFDRIVLLRAIE